MTDRAGKYDEAADRYSTRYVDAMRIAQRQIDLISRWGRHLPPGASILELGCADGFVTAELARRGFRVVGVDISPRMVDVARKRLGGEGLTADFRVGDIDHLDIDGPFDATLAMMRTFFQYVDDPVATLTKLAAISPKVIVDINPRASSLAACIDSVRRGGYADTAVRPIFQASKVRTGPILRTGLSAAEHMPIVRDLLLKKKFLQVIKGEH